MHNRKQIMFICFPSSDWGFTQLLCVRSCILNFLHLLQNYTTDTFSHSHPRIKLNDNVGGGLTKHLAISIKQ